MINTDFEITELKRKLANFVRLGLINSVDLTQTPPKVTVKIGSVITAELDFITLRAGSDKSWWPITEGEQVIVLSPGGNLTNGLVVGSMFQNSIAPSTINENIVRIDYSDGAVTEYDKESHKMKITLPSDGTLEIVASGGVTITGDLTVNGNIASTKNVTDSTRSMADDRGIYNGHTHAGVSSGLSSTAKTLATQ